MQFIKKMIKYGFWVWAMVMMTGCTQKFFIQTPTPSGMMYTDRLEKATNITVADERVGVDKNFSIGRVPVILTNIQDEMAFFKENLAKELKSRGLSATISDSKAADVYLNVYKYQMRNHQSTGFSPFQTATTLGADFVRGGDVKKVAFYFRIGKVPILSMKEIVYPCYELPLSIMIKEVASKINRLHFGLVMPTEKVQSLVNEINISKDNYMFLKVLELGYTNNPAAIEPLLKLTKHKDGYVRVSAICSLGVLGAVDQFEFLKGWYTSKDEDEKLMALKSIGDLNSPEAIDFLRTIKNSDEYGHHRIKEVIDLFIRN